MGPFLVKRGGGTAPIGKAALRSREDNPPQPALFPPQESLSLLDALRDTG